MAIGDPPVFHTNYPLGTVTNDGVEEFVKAACLVMLEPRRSNVARDVASGHYVRESEARMIWRAWQNMQYGKHPFTPIPGKSEQGKKHG
jgi:hypothetical protein